MHLCAHAEIDHVIALASRAIAVLSRRASDIPWRIVRSGTFAIAARGHTGRRTSYRVRAAYLEVDPSVLVTADPELPKGSVTIHALTFLRLGVVRV